MGPKELAAAWRELELEYGMRPLPQGMVDEFVQRTGHKNKRGLRRAMELLKTMDDDKKSKKSLMAALRAGPGF